MLKNFYDDLMKDYRLFSQQIGKGISTNTNLALECGNRQLFLQYDILDSVMNIHH